MKIQRMIYETRCISCDKIIEKDDTRKGEEGEGIEEVKYIFYDRCPSCESKR